MVKKVYLVLAAVCLLSAGRTVAQGKIRNFRQLTQQVSQYRKSEWEISLSASFTNPYAAEQVMLDMVLQSPSGKEIVLPCYYEKGDTSLSQWKARLAPRETGAYVYYFRLTDGTVTDRTAKGSFEAKASGDDGFLHVEAGSLWTFRFDDGKPFRGIGENVAWEGRAHEDPKNTFEYFLPKIARNGGTFFRTISCAWNLPMEQQIVETKRRFSRHYSNTTQFYHPQGLARTDQLFHLADSLGLYCLLTLYWHGELKPSEHWGIFPYNKAIGGPAGKPEEFFTNPKARQRFKDRLRYIIARWGYSTHLAMIDLFNEIDNATYAVIKDSGGSSSDSVIIPHKYVTAWHAEMCRYLKSIDPYGHIVASSISHRAITGLFDKGGLDVNQEHIYKKTDYLPRAIDSMTAAFGKPFVVGEYGYRWEDANPAYTKNYDYDFKKGLWYGLFSPTPVVPMTWWWEFFDQRNRMDYLMTVRQISDRMLAAGKGQFSKTTVRADGLIAQGVTCGHAIFVNLLNNDSVEHRSSVSVKGENDGPYQVQLFDPETKQYRVIPATVRNGTVEIEKMLFTAHTNTILILTPGTVILSTNAVRTFTYDIVVYGGTASGVMAAIAAAREGHTVALLEPGDHVGGMMTSGLGWTDWGKPDMGGIIGGLAKEFFDKVRDHYGKDATRRFNAAVFSDKLGDEGWYFEPHVAEDIFMQMLKEAGVKLWFKNRLKEKSGVIRQGKRLAALEMENGSRYEAKVFIDAGYEGDVMAQAGVHFTVGRESRSQYGEALAGVMPPARHTDIEEGMEQGIGQRISGYDAAGLLPGLYNGARGTPGDADEKVQAYNFRLCMTKDRNNQTPVTKPAGYDPRRYEVLARLLQARAGTGVHLGLDAVLKLSPLPGSKTDGNNQGPFSTDDVNAGWNYAAAGYAQRDRIYREHVDYTKGLLYFLSSNEKVPPAIQDEMRQWGYAKDEFIDHGNWPWQLYIREGRRMIGDYVMVQDDVQQHITKEDAIGMGSYAADSHIIQRRVNEDSLVENEGQMFENIVTRPYQIPYRVLTPKAAEASNLLVSICLSSSHVAYQTLRMEPQFMITGQAAGVAAHLAVTSGQDVQQVDVRRLQQDLRDMRAVLTYKMQ